MPLPPVPTFNNLQQICAPAKANFNNNQLNTKLYLLNPANAQRPII